MQQYFHTAAWMFFLKCLLNPGSLQNSVRQRLHEFCKPKAARVREKGKQGKSTFRMTAWEPWRLSLVGKPSLVRTVKNLKKKKTNQKQPFSLWKWYWERTAIEDNLLNMGKTCKSLCPGLFPSPTSQFSVRKTLLWVGTAERMGLPCNPSSLSRATVSTQKIRLSVFVINAPSSPQEMCCTSSTAGKYGWEIASSRSPYSQACNSTPGMAGQE